MSSFDNGTLNVGTLGFPSSGYILGINATGGIYTTNTSNQSTLTIPLSTLTSLTTGTFIVGSTYPMTAVFSTTLPAVASITINPPNSSDTIASASVSTNTLTFNWTPLTAITNARFSFVFGIQTVQSANYTTLTPNTLLSLTPTSVILNYSLNAMTATFNSTLNNVTPTITPSNGTISNALVSGNVCTFNWTPTGSGTVQFSNVYGYLGNQTSSSIATRTTAVFNSGTPSYMSIGSPISFTSSQVYTIEMVVLVTNAGANVLQAWNTNFQNAVVRWGGTNLASCTCSNYNCWAVTCDGNNCYFYINGVLGATIASSSVGTMTINNIGEGTYGGTNPISGRMFDFCVFAECRSGTQIASDYTTNPKSLISSSNWLSYYALQSNTNDTKGTYNMTNSGVTFS